MLTKWLEVARSEFQHAPISLTAKTDTTGGSISFDSVLTASVPKNRNDSNIPFSVDDWRAFYDERAAIVEHCGGLSREKAEHMAYESCISHWMNKNLPALPTAGHSNHDICPQCQQSAGAKALAVLTGNGGHIWLHDRCHTPWLARRRLEAITALKKINIMAKGNLHE